MTVIHSALPVTVNSHKRPVGQAPTPLTKHSVTHPAKSADVPRFGLEPFKSRWDRAAFRAFLCLFLGGNGLLIADDLAKKKLPNVYSEMENVKDYNSLMSELKKVPESVRSQSIDTAVVPFLSSVQKTYSLTAADLKPQNNAQLNAKLRESLLSFPTLTPAEKQDLKALLDQAAQDDAERIQLILAFEDKFIGPRITDPQVRQAREMELQVFYNKVSKYQSTQTAVLLTMALAFTLFIGHGVVAKPAKPKEEHL